MKKNIILTLLALSLSVLSASAQQKSYQQYTKNLPFKMEEVKAPVIPSRNVKLPDFGAKGDGQSLCTDAFARAID